ncbi:ribosome small subunit-dependent GTPase A [Bacteriovorax sp. DB6_IX]|uniref:ribosome small subunit-dependent GTPase A n=1 Tax=Bacteriovorax sp. DB6_IX TaxID=1353530 RepID=UPI00038A09B2|nr:ribosome small subunit-dependent GTPase A [Bacteriovorax sp. DB6_IX]EQC52682.1 ribosome small subunit-dependent GTPase A [Bacteriovorax sp. DB6_IX]
MREAKIIRSHQREFDCVLVDSKEIIKATALGNLLKKGETLVVGDHVMVDQIEETQEYVIKQMLERKNEIFRILVRESKKKVTASNCDYLVILSSVHKPKFKRGIIDRFLVRAYQWGLRPIVVFNKMDKYNEDQMDIEYEVERLHFLGIETFEISALKPDYKPRYLEKGLEDFKRTLKGSTAIFVGQSGVGKSQTITALSDGEVELKTKKVGRAGKGSHTTTWSEIVDCGDFYLIDSPGIRSFSLDDIDPEELIRYFPDLEKVALKCEFMDCNHYPDNRGCQFYTPEYDIEESEDGLIYHSRLESYHLFFDEISSTPFWKKKKKYN